ncbi:MAG: ABC transporter substrate-binding protein [Nitrososphaerales archaeon]
MRLHSKVKHAIGRVATIVIVVLIIVIIAAGGFYAVTLSSHETTTGSSIVTTSTSTTGSSTNASTPSSISVDEISAPQSLDPSTGFDVPGEEIIQSVYQTLVFYNGQSTTSFVGVLAHNYTQSSTGLNYTFNLWPNIKFSDGTSLNGSSVWFSFYRTLLLNGGISTYISQYLAVNNGLGFKGQISPSNSSLTGVIKLPWGVQNALAAAGYSFTGNSTQNEDQASLDLAAILSNFNAANSTIRSVISYPHQAIVVNSNGSVTLNLDFPYSDFYQTISGGDGSIMDPTFIDAHGGVQIDKVNSYTTDNAVGSGPYTLQNSLGASTSFLALKANPSYWVSGSVAAGVNPMLDVPKIQNVIIQYQPQEAIRISDIQGGKVQISQVEVPDLSQVANHTGITIHNWGPTATIDFLAIDAYQSPFNGSTTGSNGLTQGLDVRLAIEYGVNATAIQDNVYSGYATSYVGPLDPQMAYYNASLAIYNFNQTKAASYLAAAGYKATFPNGTTVGTTSMPGINLIYTAGSSAQESEATIIQQQLGAIGITVNPDPVNFATQISDEQNAPSSPNYPGFSIGGNSPVFIGPSDPIIYLSYCLTRCHHGDPAFLNNTQVNNLINQIIQTSNPTQLQSLYNQVVTLINQQAQYVWLDDFSAYTVASSSLTGFYYNTALDGIWYASLS